MYMKQEVYDCFGQRQERCAVHRNSDEIDPVKTELYETGLVLRPDLYAVKT